MGSKRNGTGYCVQKFVRAKFREVRPMSSKQVLLKLAAAGSVQDASRGLTGKWAIVAIVTIALCLEADHPQMLLITCKISRCPLHT